MNCTDGSKHDAISASDCYSLRPNTIRHSNTTIMQGVGLTSSKLPAACAADTEVFVGSGWKRRDRQSNGCLSPGCSYMCCCLIVSAGVSVFLRIIHQHPELVSMSTVCHWPGADSPQPPTAPHPLPHRNPHPTHLQSQ